MTQFTSGSSGSTFTSASASASASASLSSSWVSSSSVPSSLSGWGFLGPNSWGLLPGSSLCSQGVQQSPIAIQTEGNAKTWEGPPFLRSVQLNWQETPLRLVNTSRTIQIPVEDGSTLKLDEVEYSLKQFHFHSPAEHLLDGKQYAMEAHFVHESIDPDSSKTVVVGVFFEEGVASSELDKVWSYAPRNATVSAFEVEGGVVDPRCFLPRQDQYILYEGSLTTPPCTEGVQWLIYTTPVTADQVQLSLMSEVFRGPTNRPVQALNGRGVFLFF